MAASTSDKNSSQNMQNVDLSLHEMYKIISTHMSFSEVRLMYLMLDSELPFTRKNIANFPVKDPYSFFLLLEKFGMVDETDFTRIDRAVKYKPAITPLVTLKRRSPVKEDEVCKFLEEMDRKNRGRCIDLNSTGAGDQSASSPPRKRRRSSRLEQKQQKESSAGDGQSTASSADSAAADVHLNNTVDNPTDDSIGIRDRVTCDVRLRVRAEFANHEAALAGNVQSNKPLQIERQFERFCQANAILKSRDLGAIICDIKFSELTYLDAFWRDYMNGTLLEALRGVFLTESLRQAVGNEAIRLLVSVDEEDYRSGRLKLLENLKE